MIIGADSLLSEISRFWIVSIAGEKGSGKDLLCNDLAYFWLKRGYKFWSNQFHVWNDPLYREPATEQEERFAVDMEGSKLYPDIYKRVVVLSEGGRYLREYKYFEDLFEFARKMKSVFFFPSDRLPHLDLQRLLLYPRFSFQQMFGFLGGVWGYRVETGFTRRREGTFIFLPFKRYIGVYDTEDYTENPDKILAVIRKQIDIAQKIRGRDGISAMGTVTGSGEFDQQITFQRQIEQALAVSVSSSRKRR
jgi:hypothetical protein